MSKAIVAVLLPREHLPFIRHWCQYHIDQGWDDIYLYDNTGSTGSTRQSSIFSEGHLQSYQLDKRGNHYGNYTHGLSDKEVQSLFYKELEDIPISIIPWQPKNNKGEIIHGQVEAYVDFIRNYSHNVDWAAFIDADEYLYKGNGLRWVELLNKSSQLNCSRIVLSGVSYESRWDKNGSPKNLEDLKCIEEQNQGYKNIVVPSEVVRADIHFNWKMRNDIHIDANIHQYGFKHYNKSSESLNLMVSQNRPYPNLDESIEI